MTPLRFRAKAIEHCETDADSIEIGDWVEGYFYETQEGAFIVTTLQVAAGGTSGIQYWHVSIDKSTLGQSTGLTDKNGKEIFEGDIVNIYEHMNADGKVIDTKEVKWEKEICKFSGVGLYPFMMCEIIGNIYENPELLTQDK